MIGKGSEIYKICEEIDILFEGRSNLCDSGHLSLLCVVCTSFLAGL